MDKKKKNPGRITKMKKIFGTLFRCLEEGDIPLLSTKTQKKFIKEFTNPMSPGFLNIEKAGEKAKNLGCEGSYVLLSKILKSKCFREQLEKKYFHCRALERRMNEKFQLSKDRSFLLPGYRKLFRLLERISFSHLITYLIGLRWRHFTMNYRRVDRWVFWHVMLSLTCAFVFAFLPCDALVVRIIMCPVIIYGMVRVFHIFIIQINLLLSELRILSSRRLLICLLHNYVEVIFWFSLFYQCFNLFLRFIDQFIRLPGNWLVKPGVVNSLFGGLKFSFVTMTTFGSTMILSEGACINFLIFIQVIISLFFVMMSIARVVSLISKAKEIEKEKS